MSAWPLTPPGIEASEPTGSESRPHADTPQRHLVASTTGLEPVLLRA